nr:hypothetical protein [Herbaspirillum sp. B39]
MNIKLAAVSTAAQGFDQINSIELLFAIQLMETQKKFGLFVINGGKVGCGDRQDLGC